MTLKSSPYNRSRRPKGGVEVQLYSFFNISATWERVVSVTPRPLHSRDRPGTRCTEGCVGPRVGLDGCGKTRLHRDSIPGPPSP